MTGIGRRNCAGRGVRQADALTGSDTEARIALQQCLYLFLFFPIFELNVAVERLISCRFLTAQILADSLLSTAGSLLLCPAVPVSAAVCFPAGDHRRHPCLHHLPGGKEVLHLPMS